MTANATIYTGHASTLCGSRKRASLPPRFGFQTVFRPGFSAKTSLTQRSMFRTRTASQGRAGENGHQRRQSCGSGQRSCGGSGGDHGYGRQSRIFHLVVHFTNQGNVSTKNWGLICAREDPVQRENRSAALRINKMRSALTMLGIIIGGGRDRHGGRGIGCAGAHQRAVAPSAAI